MKLGTTELIVILIVVIIIFGPTQIPKLTKMFGKSVKSFKDGMDETEEDVAEVFAGVDSSWMETGVAVPFFVPLLSADSSAFSVFFPARPSAVRLLAF